MCVVSFLQTNICKGADPLSILDSVLTTDEYGIIMQRDGPSPQEENLMTRSKEEVLLVDKRTSLRVTAVGVGLSKVSNLVFL